MKNKSVNMLILVAALGYFVDIYDLILFGIVRVPSLKDLGFSGDELTDYGVILLNCQMAGMLIGGILWGVFGDIKGRIAVLFGSIFLYSAANIANGLVNDINSYAIIRFIAGVGLAGELGAGITLVSETMSKENRGWGTTIIATFGMFGAVLAAMVGDKFDWRTAYFVGGGLGLVLLLMRVGTYESGMFKQVQQMTVKKGAFHKLFTNRTRFLKYLACILMGLPTWFAIGILVIFSPEFSAALQINGDVNAGNAIMYAYIGLSIGDLLSGFLSQVFRTRKKVVIGFILSLFGVVIYYLTSRGLSVEMFYFLCLVIGTFAGYWAVFVTIASEQFGTNVRSTVTTTVPNFVRGAVVPITLSFQALKPEFGIINSAFVVGSVCVSLAIIATLSMEETFGKELDYVEDMD